jgi:hypothetical protein
VTFAYFETSAFVKGYVRLANEDVKGTGNFLIVIEIGPRLIFKIRNRYTLNPCSRYHFSAPGWSGTSRGVASVFSPNWPTPV